MSHENDSHFLCYLIELSMTDRYRSSFVWIIKADSTGKLALLVIRFCMQDRRRINYSAKKQKSFFLVWQFLERKRSMASISGQRCILWRWKWFQQRRRKECGNGFQQCPPDSKSNMTTRLLLIKWAVRTAPGNSRGLCPFGDTSSLIIMMLNTSTL